MVFLKIKCDGAFSTNTKLELLGADGPVCWIGSSFHLQPALKMVNWQGCVSRLSDD